MDRRSAFRHALVIDARLKLSTDEMAQVLTVVDDLIKALIPPCLYKADENEPVFVLRASDQSSPGAVMFWVATNEETAPASKIESAKKDAFAMTQWPVRKVAD